MPSGARPPAGTWASRTSIALRRAARTLRPPAPSGSQYRSTYESRAKAWGGRAVEGGEDGRPGDPRHGVACRVPRQASPAPTAAAGPCTTRDLSAHAVIASQLVARWHPVEREAQALGVDDTAEVSGRDRLTSAVSSTPSACASPFNRMPPSDARDWDAITAWADEVAGLVQGPAAAVGAGDAWREGCHATP